MKQLPANMTKIVCTIGPASKSQGVLEKLIVAGMNVARINFAHGDFEDHRKTIANVRAASAAVGQRVAIMGDLPGPKIRIGKLAGDEIILQRDKTFVLQGDEILGSPERASISFPDLAKVVKPRDAIYINDGYIKLEVQDVHADTVHCNVIVGGELRSHKGVNFPGVDLGISAFTIQDRECLTFAAEQGLDAISQSFVQDSRDVETVRAAAAELDYHPFIISKIERARAVDNLDNILRSTDGIMVARGDLGVEIPIEEVALVQKRIIREANLLGKPVITATHMLESMTNHSRPTRAEATDVANAILDGTDCLMLSGETAVGDFPVEAVEVMTRIALVTEPHSCTGDVAQLLEAAKSSGEISTQDLISLSIFMSSEALEPVALVTPTMSGATARRVCRFRPRVWIVAASPSQKTCQELQFSYGVYPVYEHVRPASWEHYACERLAQFGFHEHLAVLTMGSGTKESDSGSTNHIEIIDLANPPTDEVIW
jgi:pyruvate kinase